MIYRTIKIIFLSITMLLLAGCAYFQKPQMEQYISWEKTQIKLRKMDHWFISGVLSITYDRNRDTARFKWAQNGDRYNINVSGPLNMGGVRIVGDVDGVELWRSNKKRVREKNPEQLMLDQLGWELPVSDVRYWILGIPNPYIKSKEAEFDGYGHLVGFEQNGWQIKFSRFETDSIVFVELPRLIELKTDRAYIKLIIKSAKYGAWYQRS